MSNVNWQLRAGTPSLCHSARVKNAIVLGGGGVTGIAWELGILVGLARAGINLRDTDLVIGTSAGSVVGAILASGVDLESILAEQNTPAPREAQIPANMDQVLAVFGVLFDTSLKPNEARAKVGKMALEAEVGDEETYIRRFDNRLLATPWPTSPRLIITGVDAASGEPVKWDAASNVPLIRAVAASCAVPCIFPPVTIGDRRYIDGGVRSANNADLAAGAASVLVVAPMLAFSPRLPKEREKLGDANVTVVGPDAAALEAIGPNVMDLSRRAQALAAGLAQSASVAASMPK
jgi:NTE family protein